MSYKWKPSKSQAREFFRKMQNDKEFVDAYNERKNQQIENRWNSSQFDYTTAGGRYKPTKYQRDKANYFALNKHLTIEQETACNAVMAAYDCNEKAEHDYIHVVNELIRANSKII